MTREDYIRNITAEAERKYASPSSEYVAGKREAAEASIKAHISAKLSLWPLVQALLAADVSIKRTHDLDPTRSAVVDLDDWRQIEAALKPLAFQT